MQQARARPQREGSPSLAFLLPNQRRNGGSQEQEAAKHKDSGAGERRGLAQSNLSGYDQNMFLKGGIEEGMRGERWTGRRGMGEDEAALDRSKWISQG